jgi:predicted amidophosphoribosyltransferase
MSKYENNIKKLIHLLKFKHKKNSAKILSQLLFSYFQKLELKKDFILVYPSSSFLKSAWRGYEHMFLIVKEFSKLTNFEYKKRRDRSRLFYYMR